MSPIYNDTVDQGATFYRRVQLFSDEAKITPLPLSGRTVRSTLMDTSGRHVADFSCATTDAANGVFIWSMPRTLTAGLSASKRYIHSIDTDEADGTTTVRRAAGSITVNPGQVRS